MSPPQAFKTAKTNPLPNKPKKLEKKTNIKVNPNLSVGIKRQGPTFSILANENADENSEETNEDQKKLSNEIASPVILLIMMKIIIKSCGIDSTRGSEK